MPTGSDLIKKALDPKQYYGGAVGAGFAIADLADITTAENKVQALGKAIKGLVAFNLFGWSAMILGAMSGVRGGIAGVIRDSGSLEAALRRVAAVRFQVAQLAPFTQGVAGARARVAELVKEVGRPWGMDSLVAATRSLEVFTRGLYANAASLKVVSNSSIRTGNDIREVAGGVGQVYAALREGRPVAQYAQALADMGVITNQTAQELASMQQRGASVSEMFGLVEADMKRATGATNEVADSMESLQMRYSEAHEKLMAGFGNAFMKSEQAGLKNTIATLEHLAPVAAAIAQPLSQVVTLGNNFASWVAKVVTGIPGLATAASLATRSFIALGVAVAGIQLVRFAQGIIALTPQIISMVGALTGGQVAINLTAAAAGRAALANRLMADSAIAAEAAALAEAAGNTTLAASLTASSVAAERQAAVQTLAARGTTLLSGAVSMLANGMRSLLAATILNPWFLLVSALALVVGGTWHLISAHQEHVKALNELNNAGDKLVSSLDQQIASMKNLDDQQQALTDSTMALADARHKLSQMVAEGQGNDLVQAQYGLVQKLQGRVDSAQNAQGLAPSQRQQELDQRLARQAVDEKEARFQAQMGLANPTDQRIMREMRMAENAGKIEKGQTLVQERVRVEDRERTIQAQIAAADKYGTMQGNRPLGDILREKLANVRLGSTSEIVRGQAETNRDEKNKTISPDEAHARRVQLEAHRYDLEENLDRRRQEQVQLGGEQTQAERGAFATQVDLDAEMKIAAIRSRGLDAAEEEARIRLDALKIQLAGENYLDAQQRQALQNRIDGEERAVTLMREQAALQRESDAARIQIASLDRRAAEATLMARFGRAAGLRDQSIRESDAQANKESFNQKINSGQYTREQAREAVGGEQAERARQRELERVSFLQQSNRALEEGPLALSRNPEDRLKGKEMQDRDTARARIAEALKAGVTPEQAFDYAKRSGLQDLQKAQQDSGRNVIADSLQRVAGGGGVGGGDVQGELARRRTDLLATLVRLAEEAKKNPQGDDLRKTVFGF